MAVFINSTQPYKVAPCIVPCLHNICSLHNVPVTHTYAYWDGKSRSGYQDIQLYYPTVKCFLWIGEHVLFRKRWISTVMRNKIAGAQGD